MDDAMGEISGDLTDAEDARRLYRFVTEQILAGLFKSDIMDLLMEMGVGRQAAFGLMEEMERRMKNLRKRTIVLVMSPSAWRDELFKECVFSGYAVSVEENMKNLLRRFLTRVPDLIIVDAFDTALKGRDILFALRADIIGKGLPVFVLSRTGMAKEDFLRWKDVAVFVSPCSAHDVIQSARELFLKKFRGE